MEFFNNSCQPIDVEALMSRLLQRGTMMERFKLPMTKEQAYRLLLAAVKGEVEYRARIFEFNDAVKFYAETIAEWLTGDSPKFGLLLCGNVGNSISGVKLTVITGKSGLLMHAPQRISVNRIIGNGNNYVVCLCWLLMTSVLNLWKFRIMVT